MQPTEQHRNGVALSYHETRGECSHTHGRSIRVSSGNLADRRGFIVRLPAAALGDNDVLLLLSSSPVLEAHTFRLTRCERRACLVRLPEHAAHTATMLLLLALMGLPSVQSLRAAWFPVAAAGACGSIGR